MAKQKQTMQQILEKHAQEDAATFKRQDERSGRIEILIGQMGDHLSHLRKDMNVISTTQEEHAKQSAIFRAEIKASIERIQQSLTPIEKERSDENIIDERNKKRAEQVIFVTKVIVGVGAACTTVWAVFKYIIIQAIK